MQNRRAYVAKGYNPQSKFSKDEKFAIRNLQNLNIKMQTKLQFLFVVFQVSNVLKKI